MSNTTSPLIKGSKQTEFDFLQSANMFWLENRGGDSYYLESFGQKFWAIRCQESYFTGEHFEHKSDIASFEHSYYATENTQWKHLFNSKEEAVECYMKKYYPKREEK